MAGNQLFYGDNLDVLRLHIKDESVDLVYLDPPFKSDADYNVLFSERDGTQHASSGQLYEWHGIRPPASRCWAMSKENMDDLETDGRIHWPKKKGGMPRLKLYPEDLPGVPLTDVWTDVRPLHNMSAERLGYPTQKPEALLKRIIQASSKPGDTVLDPFCGCGTAIAASQNTDRNWIGIDITYLAIGLIRNRLKDSFGDGAKYDLIGEPVSLDDAKQLASQDRYQFQWWALGLVGARPAERREGADRGIDGRLYFHDDSSGETKQVIISVKSGGVKVGDLRDLRGVLDREEADIGVLITLEPSTGPMRTEAASAGFYRSRFHAGVEQNHSRLQILTIEQL